MSDPPPQLPRATITSQPRRRSSSVAAVTSTTQASCNRSVSLFTYRVDMPSTAQPAAARGAHA
jgi:hypothetical protein